MSFIAFLLLLFVRLFVWLFVDFNLRDICCCFYGFVFFFIVVTFATLPVRSVVLAPRPDNDRHPLSPPPPPTNESNQPTVGEFLPHRNRSRRRFAFFRLSTACALARWFCFFFLYLQTSTSICICIYLYTGFIFVSTIWMPNANLTINSNVKRTQHKLNDWWMDIAIVFVQMLRMNDGKLSSQQFAFNWQAGRVRIFGREGGKTKGTALVRHNYVCDRGRWRECGYAASL